MTEILVADDEKPLANFLLRGLKAEGYHCDSLHELHELLPYIRQHSPQLLILDRLFGQEDSIEMLTAIKSLPNSPMVLMLTALDEVSDRVAGLTAGADDYLCKPFDFEELLARVVALRRLHSNSVNSYQGEDDVISLKSLKIKREERVAELYGDEVNLTRIEFDLLVFLAENKDKVVSRERILSRVWNTSSDPQTNVIDVYISRLRKKIEREVDIQIETLRGNGYRLKLI